MLIPVEVLQGNQPDPDMTRRRTDKRPHTDRTLDWAARPTDILLQPHSPLALSDVLGHGSGRLDLIAQAGSADVPARDPGAAVTPLDTTTADVSPIVAPAGDTAVVTSLQGRLRHRAPRERANLLTRHSGAELADRCRKSLVENALIKQPGQLQFYVVAGFLGFHERLDEGRRELRHRAPLLFYPATLQHTPTGDDAPSGSVHYEISLNGATPETNAALMQQLQSEHGIELPDMHAHDTLQDYFSHIAEAVAGHADIELQFDMSLGNACPPGIDSLRLEPGHCLPELPQHFNASLAMQITQQKTLPQLSAVLNLLRDYDDAAENIGTPDDHPGSTASVSGDDDNTSIAEIHSLSRKLAARGLDHIEFQHFEKLPDNIDIWSDRIRQSLSGRLLKSVLDNPEITARQLVRLSGLIELIDKAPIVIEQYHHQDLCFHSSPTLLRRARHQARLIEDELETLQEVFLLDKVPAKQQLLSLIEELGGTIAHDPDVVDADYFSARRQFMEFSVEKPANLNQEHRRLLGQLAKVLRFRELFINNTEYRLALGPGYRGLRTDWQTLEQMLDYCQELSEVLESESLAAAAMRRWSDFRQTYIEELDKLQVAGDATRRLLRIAGSQWQNRRIGELLDRARDCAQSIRECQGELGALHAHGHRTAAAVLAQFSGQSREDLLTEYQVDETEAQIDQHLRSHDNATPQVLDTLAWLKAASALAVEFELDIDAIVEHLQIA